MLWHQTIEINLSVHSFENWTKKQLGHTAELIEISLGKLRIRATDFLLTLDVCVERSRLACWGALQLHLSKHQRKLTQGSNRVDAGIIEQQATIPVEHTVEETSQKAGETSSASITERRVDTDLSLVQPFFDGLSKGR